MILYEEAQQILNQTGIILPDEKIELENSLGRILAEDAISDINMPPFDKSAMDGYACRIEDIENPLQVIEVIKAGSVPRKSISKNQCSQIMTGGMIPDGANCVLKVEDIDILDKGIIRFREQKTARNICYKSEDINKNDIVCQKGTLIKPQHVAILASVGVRPLRVFKKPIVSILSTGNEIVEPGQKPEASQIRNSNGYQLYSQVLNMGANPIYGGIVKDTKEDTHKRISDSLKASDVIILTGGVSMGEFDFVPEVLKELNAIIHFKKVAIQPGKPVVFAQIGSKYIFALPGNPVSSFVAFELFTKPFLYKMMGHKYTRLNIKIPYGSDFVRKRADRKKFIPVVISENGRAMPVEYHGSAHIYAFEKAQGLINVDIGINEIKKGDLVDVRLV